jgi:hypothetical protein
MTITDASRAALASAAVKKAPSGRMDSKDAEETR